MQVTLLYFAGLREAVGIARERCELPAEVVTVDDLRAWLRARGGAWATALADGRNVRAAIDQKMVGPSAVCAVRDGTEIALFPPVTGG
jgi:molybdopterin synthase sulfur carrier subunit